MNGLSELYSPGLAENDDGDRSMREAMNDQGRTGCSGRDRWSSRLFAKAGRSLLDSEMVFWGLFAASVLAVGTGFGVAGYYVGSSRYNPAAVSNQVSAELTELAKSNPFAAQALQIGANSCSASYAAIGSALTDGTDYIVKTGAAKQSDGQQALQGVIGMKYIDNGAYSGPAAGVVFSAPAGGSSCETQTIRVVPLPQSCAVAASLLPGEATAMPPLASIPVFQLASGGNVMLVPAVNGCVAVTIEHVTG